MKRMVSRQSHSLLAVALLVFTVGASAGPQSEYESREQALSSLEKYNRLIEAEPKYAMFHTLRGDAYYALNDLHGATESYTTAIKLDDRQDNAYFGRGMALGRMGLVDDGIADLSLYIRRHPDSSVAYTKRGVRNIWRNNLEQAEKDLKRAIELDPENAEAHDDLGVVHAKHQRIKEAAHHFSTAIQIDPSYQKAYHNLAISFYVSGQNKEALEIVDAGLMLEPENRNSLLLKSSVLKAMGRLEEARKIEEHVEFLPEGNWTERSDIGVGTKQGGKQ